MIMSNGEIDIRVDMPLSIDDDERIMAAHPSSLEVHAAAWVMIGRVFQSKF